MKFPKDTVQTRVSTTLGDVILAASSEGLVGLWFHDQRYLPAQIAGEDAWPVKPDHPMLREAAKQLSEYFNGQREGFDLPFDISGGTPFQQTVWRALLNIAQGQTTSYGALAQSIGKPAAVRAVGTAIGRNPLSVAVPCHRVLGGNGSLTGYAGGLARKEALLRLEKAIA